MASPVVIGKGTFVGNYSMVDGTIPPNCIVGSVTNAVPANFQDGSVLLGCPARQLPMILPGAVDKEPSGKCDCLATYVRYHTPFSIHNHTLIQVLHPVDQVNYGGACIKPKSRQLHQYEQHHRVPIEVSGVSDFHHNRVRGLDHRHDSLQVASRWSLQVWCSRHGHLVVCSSAALLRFG